MKKLILYTIVFILLISSNYKSDNKIIWTENTRFLKTSDFKMEPHKNTDTLGASHCGVEYSYQMKETYAEVTITAVFYPFKSWLRVR